MLRYRASIQREGFSCALGEGGSSGAALASSLLWPSCAAIQPGIFGGGEALSHDARSDALRLSEKVRSRAAITHRLSLSPACIPGAAHTVRPVFRPSNFDP